VEPKSIDVQQKSSIDREGSRAKQIVGIVLSVVLSFVVYLQDEFVKPVYCSSCVYRLEFCCISARRIRQSIIGIVLSVVLSFVAYLQDELVKSVRCCSVCGPKFCCISAKRIRQTCSL
jgi:hypothetical protein